MISRLKRRPGNPKKKSWKITGIFSKQAENLISSWFISMFVAEKLGLKYSTEFRNLLEKEAVSSYSHLLAMLEMPCLIQIVSNLLEMFVCTLLYLRVYFKSFTRHLRKIKVNISTMKNNQRKRSKIKTPIPAKFIMRTKMKWQNDWRQDLIA